jgi:hypothetical protein
MTQSETLWHAEPIPIEPEISPLTDLLFHLRLCP